MELLRLTISSTSKGTKIKRSTIEVVEKTKCFDTVNKPTRRYRKEHLNKPTTNTKNTIGNDGAGFIGFTLVCRLEDENKCEKILIKKLLDEVEVITSTISDLNDGLSDFMNKRIVG